ncbi:MAG: hypothetical protein A2W31_04565 [Planctomycetes bacterium RBG_16_64_10]|nr:MAG: hypothetical protein A2W31_04565 [Planctomycetes bacterium RBG_16_64_10]
MRRFPPRIRRFASWPCGLLAFTVSWLAAAGPAWAQPETQQGGATKSYVFSYLLVLLVVALNLLVVLRSSGRTIDVKPRDEG